METCQRKPDMNLAGGIRQGGKNGKEWRTIKGLWGLYRVYIGIMEKKMGTTTLK